MSLHILNHYMLVIAILGYAICMYFFWQFESIVREWRTNHLGRILIETVFVGIVGLLSILITVAATPYSEILQSNLDRVYAFIIILVGFPAWYFVVRYWKWKKE